MNGIHKTTKVKVWGIIEGPVSMGGQLAENNNEYPDNVYMNLCKVEIESKIEHVEFFFESFDGAYEWVKHFQKSINPIEIEHTD